MLEEALENSTTGGGEGDVCMGASNFLVEQLDTQRSMWRVD